MEWLLNIKSKIIDCTDFNLNRTIHHTLVSFGSLALYGSYVWWRDVEWRNDFDLSVVTIMIQPIICSNFRPIVNYINFVIFLLVSIITRNHWFISLSYLMVYILCLKWKIKIHYLHPILYHLFDYHPIPKYILYFTWTHDCMECICNNIVKPNIATNRFATILPIFYHVVYQPIPFMVLMINIYDFLIKKLKPNNQELGFPILTHALMILMLDIEYSFPNIFQYNIIQYIDLILWIVYLLYCIIIAVYLKPFKNHAYCIETSNTIDKMVPFYLINSNVFVNIFGYIVLIKQCGYQFYYKHSYDSTTFWIYYLFPIKSFYNLCLINFNTFIVPSIPLMPSMIIDKSLVDVDLNDIQQYSNVLINYLVVCLHIVKYTWMNHLEPKSSFDLVYTVWMYWAMFRKSYIESIVIGITGIGFCKADKRMLFRFIIFCYVLLIHYLDYNDPVKNDSSQNDINNSKIYFGDSIIYIQYIHSFCMDLFYGKIFKYIVLSVIIASIGLTSVDYE